MTPDGLRDLRQAWWTAEADDHPVADERATQAQPPDACPSTEAATAAMNPPITRAEVSCIVNEELRDTISAVHHLERAIAERNVDYRDRFDRIDKACEILTTSVASMQTTVAGMQASLQLLTSERMGLRRFAAGVLQVLLTAAICYAALHFVKG